jgi:hypothetical protein
MKPLTLATALPASTKPRESPLDLSMGRESALPRLLTLLESADVVVGSRYVDGGGTRQWSLGRRCISKAGALYAR